MQSYNERKHKRNVRKKWMKRELLFQRQIYQLESAIDIFDNILEDEEYDLHPVTDGNIYHDFMSCGRLLRQKSVEDTSFHINTVSQPESQQPIDDERLAALLQSSEFVKTLRNNQEFMESLDTEYNTKGFLLLESHDLELKQMEDDAAFLERLKKMGKASRKKFTQLARIFLRGKSLPLMIRSSTKDRSILCDPSEDWTQTEHSKE